ncbi:hypothetical protein HYDPIDRAFT_107617 [Hydnomerulius pinastri MD-312]|nr:hypothetical protein HYDPIDRAFT_107617 [Hydnomerulius pinastri MD-312]
MYCRWVLVASSSTTPTLSILEYRRWSGVCRGDIHITPEFSSLGSLDDCGALGASGSDTTIERKAYKIGALHSVGITLDIN